MFGQVVEESGVGHRVSELRDSAGALRDREIGLRDRAGFHQRRALRCNVVVDVPCENLAFVQAFVGEVFRIRSVAFSGCCRLLTP